MRELKSIYELEDGSIILLSEVRYINKNFKYVDLAGGGRVLFSENAKEELDNFIIAYKEFISIHDDKNTIKFKAESLMYAPQNVIEVIKKNFDNGNIDES